MITKQLEEKRRKEAQQFEELWAAFDNDFQIALTNGDIDEAQRIWCEACETFLCQLQDSSANSPAGKPRRGQVLPTEKRCAVDTISNATFMARNSYADKVDRVIGLASDLKGRTTRLLGQSTNTRRSICYT